MIIFSSVTKSFGNGTIAIKDFSAVIEKGEMVVISGPSGSGKTTLMRLLIKEYSPSSGEIIFNDTDLSKIRNRHLPAHRRKIGVIFQDYKLLTDLNVWENIALPLYIVGKKQAEIEERVTDLLRLIGLEEKAWVFPVQLSGGEAQRVSIARALATGPNVIFADEPTGNLDREASITITKLLKKINELGTTVLIATHDTSVLEELKKARHIYISSGELEKDTQSKPIPNSNTKKEKIDTNKTSAKKVEKVDEDRKADKEEKKLELSEKSDKNEKNQESEKSSDDQKQQLEKSKSKSALKKENDQQDKNQDDADQDEDEISIKIEEV